MGTFLRGRSIPAPPGHRVVRLSHRVSGTARMSKSSKGEGPMQPVKLLERAAGTAVHAIRHPISSAAYAAGMARGLAGAAVHGAMVKGHDPDAGHVPAQRAGSPGGPGPAP